MKKSALGKGRGSELRFFWSKRRAIYDKYLIHANENLEGPY